MRINKLRILKWGLIVLFLSAIFVYLFSGLHTFLLYHKQQPPFLAGYDFFVQFLSHPGGICDYIATCLGQLLSVSWLGSILLTILIFVLIVLTDNISKAFGRFSGNLLFLLLPISLLISLLNDYNFPISIIVQLLFLFFSVGLLFHFSKTLKYHLYIIFDILMSITLYCVAGTAVFMVFLLGSLVILFYRYNYKQSIIRILPIIIFAILFPYLSFKYFYNISFESAYFHYFFDYQIASLYKPDWFLLLFYFYIPIILVLILFLNRLFPQKETTAAGFEKTNLKKANTINRSTLKPEVAPFLKKLFVNPYLQLSAQFILVIIISACLIKSTINKLEKNVVLADYYCYTEQWDKAIETVNKNKGYDLRLNISYNRAIDGLGKFPEMFFQYPQYAGTDVLFPDIQLANEIIMLSSDYYFDLGYIAESRHYAYEAQTTQPFNPRVLKRLVICNLITRNYPEAAKFLSVLEKNWLSADFVNKYQVYVNDTNMILNDTLLVEKRAQSPNNIITPGSIENRLLYLTKANILNKQAYEHLAMYYLMGNKFDQFIGLLPNLSMFYSKMPPVFEEAIIICNNMNKIQNIGNYNISNETMTRFRFMQQTLDRLKNKATAKPLFESSYKSKYYYYLLYNSPLVTKAKLLTKKEYDDLYLDK
jgi:hypothetical protein